MSTHRAFKVIQAINVRPLMAVRVPGGLTQSPFGELAQPGQGLPAEGSPAGEAVPFGRPSSWCGQRVLSWRALWPVQRAAQVGLSIPAFAGVLAVAFGVAGSRFALAGFFGGP